MSLRFGLVLLACVVGLAALSPGLGVPVPGTYLGRDADFAIMALQMLSASWAEGVFWPRWLMDTSFGLGGTTYYSYPPLAHWAAAALARATRLDAAPTLGLAMALWRLLAVGTAFLWLRRHVPAGPALAGATFAALLPYAALVDPWLRFAYGETAAIALLPLLLLALDRLAAGSRAQGLVGAALAYAALALTNLPVCCLAAHLGPLYAWGLGGRRAMLRCVLAGGLGAALAAAFLLPALGLLAHANAASLFNDSWTENLMLFTGITGKLAVIWGATLLAAGLGLLLLRDAAPRAAWRAPGLPRALAVLLLGALALTCVISLPLWLTMPQLTAVEHPWRSNALLGTAVAGIAALACAARPRPRSLLAAGLGLALLPPAYLAGVVALGHPAWPKFLPAAQRLDFARNYSGAYSWEHVPAEAAAAGWVAIIAGHPDPWPRPPLPAGAERIPGGFHLPRATGPVALPQFFFPAWQAADPLGPLPLRPTLEGFLELAPDRPAVDITVTIRPTRWEGLGWAVSAATAFGLLLLSLPKLRPSQLRLPALRPVAAIRGGTAGTKRV
ncbi:hypothetical protein E2C06_19725 [Dankookia rubra]|uniref:YfhO family protein n=1 Tax=Dankookia rubra TaxID=1442381 RepID=A0A4R5QCK8_9PROT|nr:hypothetical protein [Dankookia rubra]TDH60854.1 hypothetical protein E2C06_19725 [Dankookia rubra]